jgi:hypothetical protein
MKAIIRNLRFVLLAVVSSVVLLAGNAQCADEPLPPEVKALIGMKIPPKIAGKEPGHIPNFIRFGESMLNRQIGSETMKAELGYSEGMVGKKWPVFIVSAIHDDRTLEILDAQLLPMKLINWRYMNGKIERLKKGNFLIFSAWCQYANGDGRIIFGLEDPKVEHDGYSSRIERAWEIDMQNGHIKSIPTHRIKCAVLGE